MIIIMNLIVISIKNLKSPPPETKHKCKSLLHLRTKHCHLLGPKNWILTLLHLYITYPATIGLAVEVHLYQNIVSWAEPYIQMAELCVKSWWSKRPSQIWKCWSQGGIKCANRRTGFIDTKDLIDSEDPKHTLFCSETAFVAIYALFQG